MIFLYLFLPPSPSPPSLSLSLCLGRHTPGNLVSVRSALVGCGDLACLSAGWSVDVNVRYTPLADALKYSRVKRPTAGRTGSNYPQPEDILDARGNSKNGVKQCLACGCFLFVCSVTWCAIR